MDEDQVGKTVIARTLPGTVQGIGRVIGYQVAPTFTIERADGTRFHWRADMCESVDPDCPVCLGKGYALPEPTGNFTHDLTAIPCPQCTREG